jgi:hypothetical protein
MGKCSLRASDSLCLWDGILQVFDPDCTQAKLYNGAIRPIVEEVLEGFNCTIFAYGQTGTGKTYTMEARRCCSALLVLAQWGSGRMRIR